MVKTDTSISEQQMKIYYESLSEKDRRRYAAIEAGKIGYGGIQYISQLLQCNYRTIKQGFVDLKQFDLINNPRIRNLGGGRKKVIETLPGINEMFLSVIESHTAGSPMDEEIKWTNLTRQQIANLLAEKGIKVSVTVVDQLLTLHSFRRRKAVKKNACGTSEHRNEQFEKIEELKKEYSAEGQPIISMDSKKKELIGNLYREGKTYNTNPIKVCDHDFRSLATGVAIPHGLYDINKNIGFVQIGTSHDTSEFACDSIRYWWYNYGKHQYKSAKSILILCDGGGSNSSRHYVFKEDLQLLVNEIGIEIRIAHYPPYTSKYNPIEHRLFPHLSRACQGVIFENVNTVLKFMATATTQKGLQVFTSIIDKTYQTGRKVAQDFKEKMEIVFDDFLPQWNYTAKPQPHLEL